MSTKGATTTGRETQTRTARRRQWPLATRVMVAAMFAGALVYLVGTLLGVDPQVRTATGTVEVVITLVLGASMFTALAGWGVRSLLFRTKSGGQQAWLVLCGVVLLVSLLGPLGAANPGAMVLLSVEHLVVGAVVALGLRNGPRC